MTKVSRSRRALRSIGRAIVNMPAESIAPGSQNSLKFDTAERIGDTERGMIGCQRSGGPHESAVGQMASQQALGFDGHEFGRLFVADRCPSVTAGMEHAAGGRIVQIWHTPWQDDELLSQCRVKVEGGG